jgi:uncharacterized protein
MITHINRDIKKLILPYMGTGKAIIIYGPRRSGKTTLARDLASKFAEEDLAYYNCDFTDSLQHFVPTTGSLANIVRGKKAVIIDEAQNIENAGRVIKLLVDTYPEVQYIVTGSSSFELSDKLAESMVGRSFTFTLLPFSLNELAPTAIEKASFSLEEVMNYGTYPEVRLSDSRTRDQILESIVSGSLYRDLKDKDLVRDSDQLAKLLSALALQVGSEVSYSKLGSILQMSSITVERYISVLEKCFVVFRLDPLSSNPRKLLASRKRKVYFYDLGVRALLAGQVGRVDLTSPLFGGVFENLCILERLKMHHNQSGKGKHHMKYWRSPSSEIDYIEGTADPLSAWEIKWSKLKKFPPELFSKQFPKSKFMSINKDNVWEFISL